MLTSLKISHEPVWKVVHDQLVDIENPAIRRYFSFTSWYYEDYRRIGDTWVPGFIRIIEQIRVPVKLVIKEHIGAN